MALNKILIADDHPMARKGLSTLLKSEWNKVEIKEAGNGLEAVELYGTFKPDLTFLDYRMPQLSGFDAAKKILTIDRTARIILLTMFDSIPIAMNFLRIGGKAFISKDSDVEHIIAAIQSVIKGDYYFHSNHEAELLRWFQMGMEKNVPSISFSPRELQVCLKVSKGMTNQKIAEELKLSVRTVEANRQHLLKKTDTKNTAQLVEYVFENGIR
jgi:DNA-binding NarL/FixJ family response regulator